MTKFKAFQFLHFCWTSFPETKTINAEEKYFSFAPPRSFVFGLKKMIVKEETEFIPNLTPNKK